MCGILLSACEWDLNLLSVFLKHMAWESRIKYKIFFLCFSSFSSAQRVFFDAYSKADAFDYF